MLLSVMLKSRAKTIWLVGFMVLVLTMIAVGGVTRLTRSGLSIAEWKPVAGILPPLNDWQWNEQFELYKKTPEFQQVNFEFNIHDYKKIFMWEYLHRQLGRFIFFYTALLGFVLWRKKRLEGKIVLLLSGTIIFQGLIGWLMVKSGLQTLPRVSPYMLSVHYFLAITVLGMAYFFLSEMRNRIELQKNFQTHFLIIVLGPLLALQIFYGNLTSGLKAGLVSQTFPLMNGQFLPAMGMGLDPWWRNFFENPVTVQWIHRWIGMSTLFVIYYLGFTVISQQKNSRGPFIHLMGITTAQVIFGILNLVFRVPIQLAILHQMIASLIVLGYLNILFRQDSTI